MLYAAKTTPQKMRITSITRDSEDAEAPQSFMWNKDGRTNARRAQTVPPTREMKMPNPGTDTAKIAVPRTDSPRTPFIIR